MSGYGYLFISIITILAETTSTFTVIVETNSESKYSKKLERILKCVTWVLTVLVAVFRDDFNLRYLLLHLPLPEPSYHLK